ncbi:hypothetical protein THOB06_30015 [Vibrio rotiferianus]|nr:hypothetical protein THOG10_30015 [Vibrio rotiferianus]CAH1581482.1 hypothetical protein THOB06_30015 [Vibrio rotiferianus]
MRHALKIELWGSGPLATIARELGQVRKEAAAACDLCAGMWLGSHPLKASLIQRGFFVSGVSFCSFHFIL